MDSCFFHYFAFGSSSLGLFAKGSTCTRFTKFDLRSRSFSLSVRVPFALSSDFAFGSSSLSALHEKCPSQNEFCKGRHFTRYHLCFSLKTLPSTSIYLIESVIR